MITIEKLYEGRAGRALAWALYTVCGLFLLSPGLDLAAAIFPPHPGNIQWRFGVMVSLAPTIMTGVISLAMFAVLGVLFGHRGVLRSVGAVALLLAIAYVASMAIFALDLLQLRKAVPGERQLAFWIMSLKCLAQILTGSFVLLLLGLGCLRLTRSRGTSSVEGSGSRKGPVVLGSRPSQDNAVVGTRTPADSPLVGGAPRT
ncbi:MAG: hypothetical protein HY275_06350 [Gemmatimonadetes bacterium]|nr:hypothetical protein [Gemmatimonadota bacterium]